MTFPHHPYVFIMMFGMYLSMVVEISAQTNIRLVFFKKNNTIEGKPVEGDNDGHVRFAAMSAAVAKSNALPSLLTGHTLQLTQIGAPHLFRQRCARVRNPFAPPGWYGSDELVRKFVLECQK